MHTYRGDSFFYLSDNLKYPLPKQRKRFKNRKKAPEIRKYRRFSAEFCRFVVNF